MTSSNKTLAYINSKVWYRLLKVIFVLCLLLSLVFLNIAIASNGIKNVDSDKTSIFCTYGDKKIFTPRQLGLTFLSGQFKQGFKYKSFFEGYNDYDIKEILKNCYKRSDEDIDIFAVQKIYEVWGHDRLIISKENRQPLTDSEKRYLDEIIPKIESSYASIDKAKYVDYSVQLFDVSLSYSYANFVKYFVIGNLLLLVSFEIIRRIFYYIVLGTIKPNK